MTNRLDVLHPALAQQWDVEANEGPPQVVATSERKAWWICQQGHRWQAIIRNRVVLGAGCPRCAAIEGGIRRSTPRPGQSLADRDPALATQWHPSQNGSLLPSQVMPASNAPVWWLCNEGHAWRISPAGRTAKGGAGCPYCSGRLVTPETSLLAQRPDLAAQWHPSLNEGLTPANVKPATAASVWWQCEVGHAYRSRISNRHMLGRGCPYCSGQKVGYGNDLATRAPQVAAEWDYEKNGSVRPDSVTTGVQRGVWWRCPNAHSWKATVASRVGLGTACPYCSAGWRRSRPEIQLQCELAVLLPAPVLGDAFVRTVTAEHRVDVVCADLQLIVEYDGARWHAGAEQRDAAKTADLVAEDWIVIRVREDPLVPLGSHDVTCASTPNIYEATLKVLGQIVAAIRASKPDHPARDFEVEIGEGAYRYRSEGHLVAADRAEELVVEGRVNRTPVPRSVLPPPPKPGHSLADRSPGIAAEWHPTKNGDLGAADVANARNAEAWWLCSRCGESWKSSINGRVRRQRINCPDCNRSAGAAARARPESGQSLGDRYPELVNQWHPTKNGGATPFDVGPGSHRKVFWLCETCGKEWQTSVYSRAAGHHGCATCRKSRSVGADSPT